MTTAPWYIGYSDFGEMFRKSWIGVPRPWRSTTLPNNHVWADGSFVAFANWPELQEVYEGGGFSGLLLDYDAEEDVIAANYGKWRPDAATPTGLYTPNFSGRWIRAYTGSESDAGTTLEAGLPNIEGGVTAGENTSDTGSSNPYASQYITDNIGAFYLDTNDSENYAGHERINTGSGMNSPDNHLVRFDASRSNSIYGNSTTVTPDSVVVPIIIYLGASS